MKFAEFFAGVGLVNEGLVHDGWDCIWANDISPDKFQTYKDNYGEEGFFLGDIWDCVKEPSLIPDSAFLYTASFPCTDLSVAGARKGLAGKESGTLNAVLDIIEKKHSENCAPKLIMLENVQGFLTSHDGADVAYTVSRLNSSGYVVDIIELDASYFTPQSRKRVFLFAVEETIANQVMKIKNQDHILDDWWSIFESTPLIRTNKIKSIIKRNEHLKWGLFEIQDPKNESVHLSEIIETELNEKSTNWWNSDRQQKLFNQLSESHKETLLNLTSQDFYSYATAYRRMRKGESKVEIRTDGIAGCLRTPRGGSSKQILIRAGKDNWAVRLLTPREYARLQGVRDSFILPENDNKGYFAMGDAVCVPVIRFISEKIITPTYRTSLTNKDN